MKTDCFESYFLATLILLFCTYMIVLNTITQEILSCFDADHSSIMLLNHKTKMLKTMSSFGQGSELSKDALVPLGKGVAGWVLEHGDPLLLNGKVAPTDFPGTQKKSRNVSSSLCVPLKISAKNIGVLSVNYEYTVIGNAVNLARRLCSYAQTGQILVTDFTLHKIFGKIQSEFINNVTFKGIPEPVSVHRIF